MPAVLRITDAPMMTQAQRTPQPSRTWSVSWRHVIVVAAGAALANVLTWAALVAALPWRQPNIPLRYNIYTGISLLGPPGQLLWLPLVGLCVIVANAVLIVLLRRHSVLAAVLLAWVMLAAQVVVAASAWLILNFAT